MEVMHNEHIIRGPEFIEDVPNEGYGKTFYRYLQKNCNLPNALIDGITRQSITYKAFLEKSLRLAHSLQRFGITQNDVIAISSETSTYFPFPLIAGIWIGTPVTTYNPLYTIGELTHVVHISKPSIVFCSKASLPLILLIKKELQFIRKIIVLDSLSAEGDIDSLENFIAIHSRDYKKFEPVDIDQQRVALIMYSSGTTGLPKGVMLTYNNLTTSFMHFKDPRYFVRAPPGTNSVLCYMPFFHSFGTTLLTVGLQLGETIVVYSKFEEKSFLTGIQDFRIKTLWVVPPIAGFLAKSDLCNEYDLSHVEEIICGAAPLSKHIEDLLLKRFKKVSHVRNGYGLTETTIAISVAPIHFTNHGDGGKLFPQTIVKVIDISTGRSLKPGEDGEIYIKGPQVMKGYAGDMSSTNHAIDANGFLRTGDIGHYDDNGYIYITDRIKDLIKYKGFQVAPAELEALLLNHPKIADAAVIGKPDEIAGEVPMAFIIKNANQNLTEDEVKNYIADLVSPQKRLRGGVQFVNEIPKNPGGKILRRQLRELLLVKAKL